MFKTVAQRVVLVQLSWARGKKMTLVFVVNKHKKTLSKAGKQAKVMRAFEEGEKNA